MDNMPILIDNDEQKIFFSKLQNLPKQIKIERWGNRRTHRLRRLENISFAGKEVEYERLANLFEVLENRYRIALYCLEKIHEECEIIDENESEIEQLRGRMKKSPVDMGFVIKCEYFIFAICSCLDTMAHIINIMYNFRIPDRRVSISKLYEKKHYLNCKRDKFSKCLLKDWKKWISEFKDIRNKMTHHQIIEFSSNLSHDLLNKRVTYTKNCISVKFYEKTKKGRLTRIIEIQKSLPTYFDETIKNYERLKHEFYKKLNSLI